MEGNLRRSESAVIMTVEGGFVEVFGRRVRVRMPVGKGVDEGREAAERAERCASAFDRKRSNELEKGRDKERKFYRESHRDWGLVGMKRIVLPPRYRVPDYPRL